MCQFWYLETNQTFLQPAVLIGVKSIESSKSPEFTLAMAQFASMCLSAGHSVGPSYSGGKELAGIRHAVGSIFNRIP